MITLEDQIRCVEREISMRQRVYPKWVADGRMTADKSAHEINAMQEVLRTLAEVRRKSESLTGGA